MWAKFVFALLTIIEATSMTALGWASALNPDDMASGSHGAAAVPVPNYFNGYLSDESWIIYAWGSMLYLFISSFTQLASFVTVRRLQTLLWQVGYRNDESFVAVGTSAASVGEASIWTLGRNLCMYIYHFLPLYPLFFLLALVIS